MVVPSPTDADVLICKGRVYHNHPGTKWYHGLISSRKHAYRQAMADGDKQKKNQISEEIKTEMKGRRYLKSAGNGWYHVVGPALDRAIKEALRVKKSTCQSFTTNTTASPTLVTVSVSATNASLTKTSQSTDASRSASCHPSFHETSDHLGSLPVLANDDKLQSNDKTKTQHDAAALSQRPRHDSLQISTQYLASSLSTDDEETKWDPFLSAVEDFTWAAAAAAVITTVTTTGDAPSQSLHRTVSWKTNTGSRTTTPSQQVHFLCSSDDSSNSNSNINTNNNQAQITDAVITMTRTTDLDLDRRILESSPHPKDATSQTPINPHDDVVPSSVVMDQIEELMFQMAIKKIEEKQHQSKTKLAWQAAA